MNKDLSTNRSAEAILNILIGLSLILSLLLSVTLLVIGVAILVEEPNITGTPEMDTVIAVFLMVISIVNTITALITWAGTKIWINMSRNLFNINRKVENIEEDLEAIRMKPQE